jgi:glycosyltransferase involved in cell wall biosynthesis
MKISACLITLNEERNLPRCLKSVAPLVDEIILVDSGSTDRTLEIAHEFGAVIIHQTWLGYVAQKNLALAEATHPWVLSIDADEEISTELAAAITKIKSTTPDAPTNAPPTARPAPDPDGYQFSRIVFYAGRWIRHGDWYPDRLVRLFQRDRARFTGGLVHEKLEIAGPTPLLPGHLHHFTYGGPADRAARSVKYARLWAQSAHETGKRANFFSPYLHAKARFLKGYFLKRGFLDGPIGWDIALGNALEVWLKYALLRKMEMERTDKT